MGETIKDEINEHLGKLDTPQQRQVLEFARGLASPAGVSGSKLLQFAGTIAPADLETISRAILEGREHVDLNACLNIPAEVLIRPVRRRKRRGKCKLSPKGAS
jgi:hypothetical protein